MNTIRFTSKEAFVAALEARRGFWREADAKLARDHKGAEKEWLASARAAMRDGLKMPYAELKAVVDWNGKLPLAGDKAPDCPVLSEPKIDDVLRALELTEGKTFTVDSEGTWRGAHHLLVHDPHATRTAC